MRSQAVAEIRSEISELIRQAAAKYNFLEFKTDQLIAETTGAFNKIAYSGAVDFLPGELQENNDEEMENNEINLNVSSPGAEVPSGRSRSPLVPIPLNRRELPRRPRNKRQ